MSTLFNEYDAANSPHAEKISRKVREFANIIMESFPEYPVHEVEQVMVSTITATCAEKRIIRAIEKKKG